MGSSRSESPARRVRAAAADHRRLALGMAAALVVAMGLVVTGLYVLVPSPVRGSAGRTPPGPVQHVVEIMLENHAFDNFFGTFPGADGPPAGTALPDGHGGVVAPYWISGTSTPDPPHFRSAEVADLDGGRMDGFVEQMARSDPSAASAPMGFYNATQLSGIWGLASEFVLCDRYFASVLGPTLPNRLYAMAGAAAGITNDVLPTGTYLRTIFDQLTSFGYSWAYYSGGLLPPLPSSLVPLSWSAQKVADLRPLAELPAVLHRGTLPALTFVDPEGTVYSQHPPLDVRVGDAWVLGLVRSIEESPVWGSTVVFLTWDEGGGYYDHVAPPTMDAWGDGFRVPMIVVSPFSKVGAVDSTVFDHTSVLHFVEAAWGLPFLNERVASADDLCSTLVGLPASERCHPPALAARLTRDHTASSPGADAWDLGTAAPVLAVPRAVLAGDPRTARAGGSGPGARGRRAARHAPPRAPGPGRERAWVPRSP